MKTWDEVVEGYRQRFIEYFSNGDVPGFSEQACREMMYVLEYQQKAYDEGYKQGRYDESVENPPKTGKWTEDLKTEKEYQLMFHKVYVCSECGHQQCRPKPTNYCPDCGADMRGEKNE